MDQDSDIKYRECAGCRERMPESMLQRWSPRGRMLLCETCFCEWERHRGVMGW